VGDFLNFRAPVISSEVEKSPTALRPYPVIRLAAKSTCGGLARLLIPLQLYCEERERPVVIARSAKRDAAISTEQRNTPRPVILFAVNNLNRNCAL
jgi:hypothetical protein